MKSLLKFSVVVLAIYLANCHVEQSNQKQTEQNLNAAPEGIFVRCPKNFEFLPSEV